MFRPAVGHPLIFTRTSVSRAAKRLNKQGGEKAASRFPKFMRAYAERINQAPVSHITSFLLLHELSAIVPLFGFWGGFYYFDYVPGGIPDWVIDHGTNFIKRMAERNDWHFSEAAGRGSRIVLQGAASYAIVKAIMPLRLVFSVWATPFTAKWLIIPISSRLKNIWQLVGRSKH